MDLHLRQLSKRYADTPALDGIDLDIASNELVALLGPSGSGKTTLLRVIAGLLGADSGQVLFGDTDATRLSLRERNVGFVFQHYALFRHMSVAENIAFGLRSRPRAKRPPKADITRRVDELLALIQLPEMGARFPDQLSGGQKQRVALARALAIDPTVLLLDEPFGALDAKVRVELRRWLRRLHEQTGQTTLFVTHDQEEALELADRVVVLRNGRIEQVGTPDAIYRDPATAFVYEFIGRSNVLDGDVQGGVFRARGLDTARWPAPDVRDGVARMYVRPHDLTIASTGDGASSTSHDALIAHVAGVRRLADRLTLDARIEGQARVIEVDMLATSGAVLPSAGDPIELRVDRLAVFAIPA